MSPGTRAQILAQRVLDLIKDLQNTAKAQKVEIQKGDILPVRLAKDVD
jgi:hypothetical protein